MSTEYGAQDRVPTEILISRLEELSRAVTEGKDAVSREFTMRIPAEMDRDADLVLHAAACRLREYAIGFQRYEVARRMNPRQWADAWKLNTTTGKPFDEIIEDLRPFMTPNASLSGRGDAPNTK